MNRESVCWEHPNGFIFSFQEMVGKAIYSRPVILDLSKFSVGGHSHSGEGSGQRKRAK